MKKLFSILLLWGLAFPCWSRTNSDEVLFPPRFINFTGAPLTMLLPKYAELVGRNILRSPAAEVYLKKPLAFTNETPLTWREAIQTFEAILATNGVRLINVGDKFVKVIAAKEVVAVIGRPAPTGVTSTNESLFPPRHIRHNGTELGVLLKLYSGLIGREVSPAPKLGNRLHAPVFFENQTTLTWNEAIQAYDEIFAMNGIGFVSAGNEGLRAVPASEVNASSAGAANPSTPNKK